MEGGKWVGFCDKAGYERMAGIRFPCERWSAVVAAMEISKCVMKNLKHRRRCITSASFEEDFLMAATRLSLLHWKLMLQRQSLFPQVTHVNRFGTSSFATIPTFNHSKGHCHWDHSVSKTVAHPHIPETSI